MMMRSRWVAALVVCLCAIGSAWMVSRSRVPTDALMGFTGARDPTHWKQAEARWRRGREERSMARVQDSEQQQLSDMKLLSGAVQSQNRDMKIDAARMRRDMRDARRLGELPSPGRRERVRVDSSTGREARKLHKIHRQLMRTNSEALQHKQSADASLLREAMAEQNLENRDETLSYQRDFEAAQKTAQGGNQIRTDTVNTRKKAPMKGVLKTVLGANFDKSAVHGSAQPAHARLRTSSPATKKSAREEDEQLVQYLTSGWGSSRPHAAVMPASKKQAGLLKDREQQKKKELLDFAAVSEHQGAHVAHVKRGRKNSASSQRANDKRLVRYLEASEYLHGPQSRDKRKHARKNVLDARDEKKLVEYLSGATTSDKLTLQSMPSGMHKLEAYEPTLGHTSKEPAHAGRDFSKEPSPAPSWERSWQKMWNWRGSKMSQ